MLRKPLLARMRGRARSAFAILSRIRDCCIKQVLTVGGQPHHRFASVSSIEATGDSRWVSLDNLFRLTDAHGVLAEAREAGADADEERVQAVVAIVAELLAIKNHLLLPMTALKAEITQYPARLEDHSETAA